MKRADKQDKYGDSDSSSQNDAVGVRAMARVRRLARVWRMTRTGTALLLSCGIAATAFAAPRVRVSEKATPRELFAEQRLQEAVKGLPGNEEILLATRRDPLLQAYDAKIPDFGPDAKEAFLLRRLGNTIIVAGCDPSGVLYGAMELADAGAGGTCAACCAGL